MGSSLTKFCKYGQHNVPVSEFNRDNKASDGLQTHCKPCKKIMRAETVAAKKSRDVSYEGEKQCRTCTLTKPRTEFDIDWRNADCLQSACKPCDKTRLQDRKSNLTPVDAPDLTGTKTCTNCDTEKPRTEFNKDRYRSDGLFPWCRDCGNKNSKNHYNKNKEPYKVRATIWTKDHRDINNICSTRWKKANPERVSTHSAQRRDLIGTAMTPRDTFMSAIRRKRIKNNPCHYCGLRKDIMHTDHYIPIAVGGTDHFWNLVRACIDCNLSKGIMTGYEFIHKSNSLDF